MRPRPTEYLTICQVRVMDSCVLWETRRPCGLPTGPEHCVLVLACFPLVPASIWERRGQPGSCQPAPPCQEKTRFLVCVFQRAFSSSGWVAGHRDSEAGGPREALAHATPYTLASAPSESLQSPRSRGEAPGGERHTSGPQANSGNSEAQWTLG